MNFFVRRYSDEKPSSFYKFDECAMEYGGPSPYRKYQKYIQVQTGAIDKIPRMEPLQK